MSIFFVAFLSLHIQVINASLKEKRKMLTLLPIIRCTSSSGETGVVARSGFELLMLFDRDKCRLLGRAVALESVAYWIGISYCWAPAYREKTSVNL